MGDPTELKKDDGWSSLDGTDEETERADPFALEQVALENGEHSLIPQELFVEAQEPIHPTAAEAVFIQQKVQKMTIPQKLRLAQFGNVGVRALLIHDRNKAVALSVLRNPKLQESEVLAFAQMKNVAEDVLKVIAKDKNWGKNYTIKLALVSNSKTPLSAAIRFLDHLYERDLQNLARSRNISSVLAKSAGRVLIKRKGAK